MPIGSLAALAGSRASATLPILAGAIVAFLVTRARIGEGEMRLLDGALVGLTVAVALQTVPLPRSVVDAVSPHTAPLRTALYFDVGARETTLSVNASATRAGLGSLAAAVLLFWAARETFHRGGLRVATGLVAAAGFLLVLVSLAQHATSPRMALWLWKPADPEAVPLGPFLNRNHLATWLLMAASLTAGYMASHARAFGARHASIRLRLRDWLADGKGLFLAGALATMILGIAATLSRAAILGAVAALAVAFRLRKVDPPGRTVAIVGMGAAVLLAGAVWFNQQELARKFDAVTTSGRLAIWGETLRVAGDFRWAGCGVGTYGPTMLHYQRIFREVHFNQAHSEYLQTVAEGGLLVAVPLALAVWAGVRLAGRRLLADGRAVGWMRVGAAAGLAAVAVQGFFETGLRVPANGLLAALLAAVVLHRPHEP